MSGLLCEVAHGLPCNDRKYMVSDPSGDFIDLSSLLMDAAESLDDAHEEWLQDRQALLTLRSM